MNYLQGLTAQQIKTNADDMTSAEKNAWVNLITSIIAGITQMAGGAAAMANSIKMNKIY